jgi:hypothetical protein
VAMGWPRLQWQALVAVQVFLFAYLAALAFTHFLTGAQSWAYAIGFGIGFMALFLRSPLFFSAAAGISYGLLYLGLRASLAGFPWEEAHSVA